LLNRFQIKQEREGSSLSMTKSNKEINAIKKNSQKKLEMTPNLTFTDKKRNSSRSSIDKSSIYLMRGMVDKMRSSYFSRTKKPHQTEALQE